MPSAGEIRGELERILASTAFVGAGRRGRLLRFLVEQSLSGDSSGLKESVLAVEVFDRPPDHDPALHSVVRVEMGRLRSRLIEYYAGLGKNDPVRIEIPKGSYAPVFTSPAAAPPEPVPPEPVPPLSPHRRWRWAAAAAVLLLAAGAVLFSSVRPGRDTISIAILPFLNLTGDPNQEFLSDGITDELTELLAETPGLRVVARTSAFQFKGKGQDIREIARSLNVSTLLEGSVTQSGTEIQLIVQLIRASDGFHLWSRTLAGPARNLRAIETETAVATRQVLLPAKPVAAQAAARAPDIDPEAHDRYMRAIYQLQLHTPDSLRESLRLSQEAVRIDPRYSRAYLAIARAATNLGAIHLISGREAANIGKEAVTKALAIDPAFSDAHAYLAYYLYVFDWDWPRAEREFKLALDSGGSHAQAHSLYGWSLMTRKRFAESRTHLLTAEELDPQSPGPRQNLVTSLIFASDFPAAKREVDGLFHLYPKSLVAARDQGWIAILQHDCPAAHSAAQQLAGWYPQQAEKTGTPTLKATCGEPTAARTQLEQMEQKAKSEFVSPYTIAQGYAALGDAARAVENLRNAADLREDVLLYSGVDTLFDPVRSDPRFIALQKELGLSQ